MLVVVSFVLYSTAQHDPVFYCLVVLCCSCILTVLVLYYTAVVLRRVPGHNNQRPVSNTSRTGLVALVNPAPLPRAGTGSGVATHLMPTTGTETMVVQPGPIYSRLPRQAPLVKGQLISHRVDLDDLICVSPSLSGSPTLQVSS